ncbi:hypothetical protein [Floridanema aerugineum]|uniref:Uncharacterized protein n=1 Tax=Floridaenema aerugineum BLCC-F46 TaxID=3153654 RepID=A0ABV4XA28_9CYAN
MAAAITTTSTTLEGQLFEVANALQASELALPEASRPNRISIAYDTENLGVTISVNFSVNNTVSGSQSTFSPIAYLP